MPSKQAGCGVWCGAGLTLNILWHARSVTSSEIACNGSRRHPGATIYRKVRKALACSGTNHRMSPKHLDRYVDEFSGRHTTRCADTVDQMSDVARGMVGRRLRYRGLIKPNGRPSGARELAR